MKIARNQTAKTTHFARRPAGKVKSEPRTRAHLYQRWGRDGARPHATLRLYVSRTCCCNAFLYTRCGERFQGDAAVDPSFDRCCAFGHPAFERPTEVDSVN